MSIPTSATTSATTIKQISVVSSDIHGDSNFPQGCQISPDGLCVLTATAADNFLRLYNVPPIATWCSEGADVGAGVGAGVGASSVSGSGSGSSASNNDDIMTEDKNGESNDGHNGQDSAATSATASTSTPTPSCPPWQTSLYAREGDSIRSYCWYPLMNSYHPPSCAFLACSRDQPIHLIDAYTSKIRASYRPYNALDEMESPSVITFTPDGSRIFASGFKTDRTIHVFDTAIPGRDCSNVLRLGKTRRSKDGQRGIVSALAFPGGGNGSGSGYENNNSTRSNVFAVGTYSPGSIYIYDDRRPSGDPAGTVLHGGMCIVGHGKSFTRKKRRFVDMDSGPVEGPGDIAEEDIFSMAKVNWYQNRARGGITQLMWSPTGGGDDFYLYSASRRSDAVLMWDMRVLTGNESYPIRGLMSFPRESDTNQRLEFDLSEDGTRLFAGSQDKTVKIYDTKSGMLVESIGGFDDVVNGISYKSVDGKSLLAVTSGARRFDNDFLDDQDVGVYSSSTPGSLSLFQLL